MAAVCLSFQRVRGWFPFWVGFLLGGAPVSVLCADPLPTVPPSALILMPPQQLSSNSVLLTGHCIIYTNETDVFGYPCNQIKLTLVPPAEKSSEAQQQDVNFQTSTDGQFKVGISNQKRYRIKIESNRYIFKTGFDPVVLEGEGSSFPVQFSFGDKPSVRNDLVIPLLLKKRPGP